MAFGCEAVALARSGFFIYLFDYTNNSCKFSLQTSVCLSAGRENSHSHASRFIFSAICCGDTEPHELSCRNFTG
jgi:hypothetical protein